MIVINVGYIEEFKYKMCCNVKCELFDILLFLTLFSMCSYVVFNAFIESLQNSPENKKRDVNFIGCVPAFDWSRTFFSYDLMNSNFQS